MIAGITGTREGATGSQLAWLYEQLESGQITEIHHGACLGVDEAAHWAALDTGKIRVHVWPPVNPRYLAQGCLSEDPMVTVHSAMPYLNRDREIVRAAQGLLALPKQLEQPERALWGGTWYTVDFAERINVPVTICNPEGVVTQRLPSARAQEF
jgi:hypothetical protein